MIYSKYKQDIREVTWFDNRLESKLMIRARVNTLDLNWRKRFKNEDTRCERCHYEIEDLEHFPLHCNPYSDIRQQ